MKNQNQQKANRMVTAYWSMVAVACVMLVCTQPVLAEDIFVRLKTMLNDIYGQILGISTIVAVTTAAIALVVRMVSRSQRAVDEATSWLKRIVITWIVINSLGFFVTYLQPLVQGGKYVG